MRASAAVSSAAASFGLVSAGKWGCPTGHVRGCGQFGTGFHPAVAPWLTGIMQMSMSVAGPLPISMAVIASASKVTVASAARESDADLRAITLVPKYAV